MVSHGKREKQRFSFSFEKVVTISCEGLEFVGARMQLPLGKWKWGEEEEVGTDPEMIRQKELTVEVCF